MGATVASTIVYAQRITQRLQVCYVKWLVLQLYQHAQRPCRVYSSTISAGANNGAAQCWYAC